MRAALPRESRENSSSSRKTSIPENHSFTTTKGPEPTVLQMPLTCEGQGDSPISFFEGPLQGLLYCTFKLKNYLMYKICTATKDTDRESSDFPAL